MKKKDFNERINNLNLNQKDFAEMIGYSHQSIKQWKDNKIPKWVSIVLEHFEELNVKKEKYNKYYGLQGR